MPEFEDLQKLLIYFLFGFISTKIWQLITPSENTKATETYLDILAYGVFFKFIYDYLNAQEIIINKAKLSISLPVTLLLIITTPFILKWILNLKFISSRIVKTVNPSAWDFFFSKQEECLVFVYLKEKTTPIVGYYGPNSFASSFPNSRSLYLETVYEFDSASNSVGAAKDNSFGIIINENEIEKIEFKDKSVFL